MIKTFADKETQELFIAGKSRSLPADLIKKSYKALRISPLRIKSK
jgi:hypothetical protein